MWKRIKIILGITIAIFAGMVTTDVVYCGWDQGAKPGRAKADLEQIGGTVGKLMEEGKLNWEAWDTINGMGDLAPFVVTELEQGQSCLNDPCSGKPYLLKKRYTDNQLVVTIRSHAEPDSTWCGWNKRVLGIEITISKDQRKVTQIKQLWAND